MREFFDSLKSLDDINALIADAHHESETVEYKRASTPFSNKEKDEIAKDVSAMAHSGGGTIIYGVATDPVVKIKPVTIEPIDPKNIESFSRVVNSSIQRRIEGIQQRALPPDKPQVLVVYVPQSQHSPHQSNADKTYYHRSGIESLPMGHDLVALHFGRRLGPLLDLEIELLNVIRTATHTEVSIRGFISNSGQRVGRFIQMVVSMPPLVEGIDVTWGSVDRLDGLRGNRPTMQHTNNVGVIHPETNSRTFDVTLKVNSTLIVGRENEPLLNWVIFADEMTKREGQYTFVQLLSLPKK